MISVFTPSQQQKLYHGKVTSPVNRCQRNRKRTVCLRHIITRSKRKMKETRVESHKKVEAPSSGPPATGFQLLSEKNTNIIFYLFLY